MMAELREKMLAPKPRKLAPKFTTTQLSNLCGIDRGRLNYLIKSSDLPPGELHGTGRSRSFTLAETRQWIKTELKIAPKPAGHPAEIIICCNFKGGSTKTTTAM